VQVALQPALDARGKAAGVIAVLHDIGAQREIEDAMNLLTARLLALTEDSFLPTMIETTPGDIELVNDAFCRLLALESAPQSLSGLPVEQVLSRSPLVDAKALAKVLKKSDQAGAISLKRADGRTVTLERQPIIADGEPAAPCGCRAKRRRRPRVR
jgi:PAS domain-containing protein